MPDSDEAATGDDDAVDADPNPDATTAEHGDRAIAGPAIAALGAVVLFFGVALSVVLEASTLVTALTLLGVVGLVAGVVLDRSELA